MQLEEYLAKLTNPLQSEQSKKDISRQNMDQCPLCNGNLFILYEDEKGYSMSKECECRKTRIAENRLKFANIPESYKGMRLNNFKWDIYKSQESRQLISISIDIIKKYISNMELNKKEGLGLYIYSNVKGSGKTRLAASLANEFIDKYSIQVKFAVSTKILAEIKKTYEKDNNDTESKLIEDICKAQILIIDDFGTEKISDWVNEKFFDIINERYLNKKVTIFTSNLSVNNLPHDERIKSRIKERVVIVKFPEESIRDRISENLNNSYLEVENETR